MQAYRTNKVKTTLRPFDATRDGFVLGGRC